MARRPRGADPPVRHRGLVQYASDPELGEIPHIRTLVRIGESIGVRTVAPKLGQHNAEIFARFSLSTEEMKALRKQKVI
jgi:crotonobetainyl-CoA:carnitine CoA-transferase CaiB-like acyl-CoA transferase